MMTACRHNIATWMEATSALSDGAYRVYHVVLQLVLLNEGPITLNSRGLAGRCNRTPSAVLKALDELSGFGFLIIKDGQIWPPSMSGLAHWEREPITRLMRDQILVRDGFACVYCGDKGGPFHIDHIHPHSRGGLTIPGNLATACIPCNLSKGSKLLEEWL